MGFGERRGGLKGQAIGFKYSKREGERYEESAIATRANLCIGLN